MAIATRRRSAQCLLSGQGVCNTRTADWPTTAPRRGALRLRRRSLRMRDRASFQVGGVAATGLLTGSCAAVVCLDVLPYVPDKAAALRAADRILVPEDGAAARLGSTRAFPIGSAPPRRQITAFCRTQADSRSRSMRNRGTGGASTRPCSTRSLRTATICVS
jgi:hypothetical protein